VVFRGAQLVKDSAAQFRDAQVTSAEKVSAAALLANMLCISVPRQSFQAFSMYHTHCTFIAEIGSAGGTYLSEGDLAGNLAAADSLVYHV
jgi:hypothetical protein